MATAAPPDTAHYAVDRPTGGDRAVLVHVAFGERPSEDHQAEFRELAESAGAIVVACEVVSRASPEPKYLIGSGKVEQIRAQAVESQVELALVDHALTPSQERNLERALGCRVLDRSGLILDIFAQRARSHEGKLQVELAQLRHLSTRLVRGWTHLERQKGGIGLRGPGETQLETDRRLIGHRIRQLRARLERVRSQRAQGRSARRRADIHTVSLVGYTNAGKSTLFNALTDADAYAKDQLFATLDPTLRRMALGRGETVVLADTVGFIRELPHELVAAFHATLQETQEASLLLHVVDASDEHNDERQHQVAQVLEEIDALAVPTLIVMNKIDRTDVPVRVDRDEAGRIWRVWVSAATGAGLDVLRDAIGEHLRPAWVEAVIPLSFAQGRVRARLYGVDAVVGEVVTDDGWRLRVSLAQRELDRLCHEEGCTVESLCEGVDAVPAPRPAASPAGAATEMLQEVSEHGLE